MLGTVDIAKRKKSAKRQIEKIIGISRQNITVCLRRTVIDTVQTVRVNFMLRSTYRFHRVIHRVNHTDSFAFVIPRFPRRVLRQFVLLDVQLVK